MKTKLKKHKQRMHYALFSPDTPFKQKVVERKDLYTRKIKHKHSELFK